MSRAWRRPANNLRQPEESTGIAPFAFDRAGEVLGLVVREAVCSQHETASTQHDIALGHRFEVLTPLNAVGLDDDGLGLGAGLPVLRMHARRDQRGGQGHGDD